MSDVTPEARIHHIRAALQSGDRPTAEYQFAELLRDSESRTAAWLRRTVAYTPALHNASALAVCDELRQELSWYLWERIAIRQEVAWERTYWSALTYAQQHVAMSYMRQAGYWHDRKYQQATRGVAMPLFDEFLMDAEAPDLLATTEVTDLVMRLPPKERTVVVLRYWWDMREREIAEAVGCTDRNVRILLHQAQDRIAAWYQGQGDQVVVARGEVSV